MLSLTYKWLWIKVSAQWLQTYMCRSFVMRISVMFLTKLYIRKHPVVSTICVFSFISVTPRMTPVTLLDTSQTTTGGGITGLNILFIPYCVTQCCLHKETCFSNQHQQQSSCTAKLLLLWDACPKYNHLWPCNLFKPQDNNRWLR